MRALRILARRELTSTWRDPRTAVVIGVIVFVGVFTSAADPPQSYSDTVESTIALTLFAVAVSVALAGGDTFARERAMDTSSLVRLSGSPAYAVVGAKWIALVSVALFSVMIMALFGAAKVIAFGIAPPKWIAVAFLAVAPLAGLVISAAVLAVAAWMRMPRVATPVALVASFIVVLPVFLNRALYPTPVAPLAEVMRALAWGDPLDPWMPAIGTAAALGAGYVVAVMGYAWLRTAPPGGE